MKNPFKKIGKIITAPFRGVKKGVDKVQKEVINQIILLIVRHGLTALGAGGVLSNDEVSQTVGAVSIAVSLIWSAWRKIARAKPGANGDGGGASR